jgi:putative oxidoreductase
MPTNPVSLTGITVLRVVIGVVFLMHGWQKVFQNTIPGTQAGFAGMGIPAAELVAPVVAILELAGGAALIVGLLTRPVALLLALVSAGAMFLVHLDAGFFAGNGGYEFVLTLAVVALAVALIGPGQWSADAALARKNNRLRILA